MKSNEKVTAQAVAASAKLQVKLATVQLDTVEARRAIIQDIRDISESAKASGNLKIALEGLKIAVIAIESLDERLGGLKQPLEIEKPQDDADMRLARLVMESPSPEVHQLAYRLVEILENEKKAKNNKGEIELIRAR